MPRSLVALVLAVMLPLPVLAGQVTVKPGETLSEIAERNGISVTRLMAINGIRDADQVQAGQVLTLPGGATRAGGSARSGAAGTITVQPGETLSELAERNGISVTRLMAINGIRDADQVQAGQVLTLPGGATRAGGSARSGAAGTITVQPGETLSELSERHGIGLNQLMQMNGLRDPDALEAGQSLRVSTARPAAAAPSYPRGASSHVVRNGESLSAIASGYGISLNKLIAINGIEDPHLIESGTRLKLKGQPPARPAATASSSRPAAARPGAAAAARPAPGRPAVSSGTASSGAVAAAGPAAAAAPRSSAGPTAAAATPRPATTAAAAGAARPIPAASAVGSGAVAAASPAAAAAPRSSARPMAAAASSRPASSTVPATTLARADWRTYGPLQVNWAAWQSMGGSMVAPTLNAKGQALYVAVNCNARKINATTVSGQWQAWGDPSTDYEQQLIRDYCRSGG